MIAALWVKAFTIGISFFIYKMEKVIAMPSRGLQVRMRQSIHVSSLLHTGLTEGQLRLPPPSSGGGRFWFTVELIFS